MSKGASVVFVAGSTSNVMPSISIEDAQQAAVAADVPFCIVYCMEVWGPSVLEQLMPTETVLATLNIPLIVLVGPAKATLAGFMHHTNPLQQFGGSLPDPMSLKLSKHPVAWPGVVIPIQELIQLQAAGKLAC